LPGEPSTGYNSLDFLGAVAAEPLVGRVRVGMGSIAHFLFVVPDATG
jgi:hypothetical protein